MGDSRIICGRADQYLPLPRPLFRPAFDIDVITIFALDIMDVDNFLMTERKRTRTVTPS